jgi:hypothetical protein
MIKALLLLLVAVTSQGQLVTVDVIPEAFLKLNDSRTDDNTGTPYFGNGATTAGAYDSDHKILYVIGEQRNYLVDWLVGWLPGWLVACLLAWLSGWLVGCLVTWLVGQ